MEDVAQQHAATVAELKAASQEVEQEQEARIRRLTQKGQQNGMSILQRILVAGHAGPAESIALWRLALAESRAEKGIQLQQQVKRRTAQVGKHMLYRLLWATAIFSKRLLLTKSLLSWHSQMTRELAICTTRQIPAARTWFTDESIVSSRYQESIEGLWLQLLTLEPNKISQKVFRTSTLDAHMFLQVCAVYAPEVSSAGIRETLCSLGLQDGGRIAETVFQQWMAIMFAGCTDEELEYGVAELGDAASFIAAKQSQPTGIGPV